MNQTVLIVEDEPAIQRGLRDNFRAAGFEVNIADDGQQGLAIAMIQRPQLIILDIMLPKLNGFEFCRRVRSAKIDVPILMLTAKSQEEDIVRGLNLGADDYVTKPFGIGELMARSKRLLRSHRPEPDTPPIQQVKLGDCSLDHQGRCLVDQQGQTSLTSKEYLLLNHLLNHPHRALTRSNLLNHVWGHSVLVSHRSVDRCVTTLRSKLERCGNAGSMIQTIRGVGYRFEPLVTVSGQRIF